MQAGESFTLLEIVKMGFSASKIEPYILTIVFLYGKLICRCHRNISSTIKLMNGLLSICYIIK